MNRWFGIGNLTDDPEMRYTGSGTPVTNFSIAINNGKDDRGNERDPTYVDITAWDKTAENVAEYCRKGNKVAVEGALQVDKWKDDDGNNRKKYVIRAFTVEFLTPRERNDDDDDRRPSRSRDRDERPARGRDRDERPSRGRDERPARRQRDELDDLPF